MTYWYSIFLGYLGTTARARVPIPPPRHFCSSRCPVNGAEALVGQNKKHGTTWKDAVWSWDETCAESTH